jgi:hypothetical protein
MRLVRECSRDNVVVVSKCVKVQDCSGDTNMQRKHADKVRMTACSPSWRSSRRPLGCDCDADKGH